MPKLKTRKAVAKRFKATGTGKFKYAKCNKHHLMTDKAPKRKRSLRHAGIADGTNEAKLRKMLPYS